MNNSKIRNSVFMLGLMTSLIFQSTLVAYAQECLPSMRGTAMSLVSFNMVLGGGTGTLAGGAIMNSWGTENIYLIGAVVLFAVGLLSTMQIFSLKRGKTDNSVLT